MKKRKKRRAKRRIFPKILITILVLAAICAGLYFLGFWGFENGRIRIGKKTVVQVDETPVAYIKNANQYLYVNKDGYVLEVIESKPTDMPEIKGFEFTQIAVGQPLTCENQATLEYAMKVIKDLRMYSLKMDSVAASEDTQLIMYNGRVKILLGENNRTDEKISDLSNFFDQIEGMDGTLDMKEISDNNLGYTFKKNK